MTERPRPDPKSEPKPEPRKCPSCNGPYDQAPADQYIPVCTRCQRGLSVRP